MGLVCEYKTADVTRRNANSMSSKDLTFAEDGADFEMHEDDMQSGCKAKCLKVLKDNLFMLLILAGVALGFGLGFGLRAATQSPIAEQWISEY